MEENTAQLEEWVAKFDSKLGQLRVEITQAEREINNSNMASEAIKEQFAKVCNNPGCMHCSLRSFHGVEISLEFHKPA